VKASSFYDPDTHEFKAWKFLFTVFLVVAVVALLGWGAKLIFLPARTATAVLEKTLDADRIIYTYEWFYTAYEGIGATQNKLLSTQASTEKYAEALPVDKTLWSYTDRKEYERLNGVMLGLQNILQDQIAKYNARSRMVTRNKFKGWGLPDRIEPTL